MAFRFKFPTPGTIVPPGQPGSILEELRKLPAFREYTTDLVGIPLFLPRTRLVVVPFRLVGGGGDGPCGAGCLITIGSRMYPQGGYAIDVSGWELQRAERLSLTVDRDKVGERGVRQAADGSHVMVTLEPTIEVEPYRMGSGDSALAMLDRSPGVRGPSAPGGAEFV